MKKAAETIQSGDAVELRESSAREIDKRLSELSRLYLERFKAMRAGSSANVQKISAHIYALKIQLNQL